MTYKLILGDRLHSSWSLRGWLLFKKFGLAAEEQFISFAGPAIADQLRAHAPAKSVPTVICADGTVMSDSLSIAEELAARHPEAGLWPEEPVARGTARNLAAEMHAGFSALRTECPMNFAVAYRDVPISDALQEDLNRIELIWAHARVVTSSETPWLCGAYSAADAFFAPVAARIAGYSLPVGDAALAYVAAHMTDPAVAAWRAKGLAEDTPLPRYDLPHPVIDWPFP